MSMATLAQHQAFHERRNAERRRVAYPAMLRGGDGMRVSWGGIFGGVLVALGVLLLLAALGVAVGITAAQPGETDAATLGTGAGIWAALSLLAALFIGGMVSTRIGAIFDRATGVFEGVLVWVVSVLLVAYLGASGVGMLASGAAELVGGAGQAIGEVVGAIEQKAGQVQPEATRAAWITFGALLISLLAAVFGAMAGRRRPGQMVVKR
jgi:hypothetical protein